MRLLRFDAETEELEKALEGRKTERSQIICELVEKYGPGPFNLGKTRGVISFVCHKAKSDSRPPLWITKTHASEIQVIE